MPKTLVRVLIALSLLVIFFFSRPVFAVVLAAALLVNKRLWEPMRLPRKFYAILAGGMIVYAGIFIAYQCIREQEWLWVAPLVAIAPSVIGFLCYACLLVLLKDVLFLIMRKGRSVAFQRVAGLLIVSATLYLGIISVKNSSELHVKEVNITLPEGAEGLDGLTIVQITDTHITRDTPAAWVEELVALSNAQNADLIVVTGDIIESANPEKLLQLEPFTQLRARYGVYSVLGNHDYFHTDIEDILARLHELKLEPLNNENRLIEHGGAVLLLAGVTDPVAKKHAALLPSPAKAAVQEKSSDYKLLLSHQPVLAPEAEKAGFDLQLSGHTHGGQFFPWTALADAIADYNRGLFELGKMKLYVSEGTGSWIPLRLGTQAEITVIKLTR